MTVAGLHSAEPFEGRIVSWARRTLGIRRRNWQIPSEGITALFQPVHTPQGSHPVRWLQTVQNVTVFKRVCVAFIDSMKTVTGTPISPLLTGSPSTDQAKDWLQLSRSDGGKQ